MTARFERYVAIGDSSTEGLMDPDGRGGFHGWANRLAERVAAVHGSLLYANLGVRGRRTAEIRHEQLTRALAMRPDLVTLFSGTNDVVSRRFDADLLACDVEEMHRALVGAGATVLTFTLPDLTPVLPIGRLFAGRVRALNEVLRGVAARTGVTLVDFAAHPVASDVRLWSEDRLHANALGHARIAQALAHALGLPGANDSWSRPLPAEPSPALSRRVGRDVRWGTHHLVPWLWRHLRGRSSGDGRGPKRPALSPMAPG